MALREVGPLQSEEEKVQVGLEGQALQAVRDLQERLGVEDEEAVVQRGIELLLSAVGKDVLLRDGSRTEVVRLWSK
jgi:hypothetical protein